MATPQRQPSPDFSSKNEGEFGRQEQQKTRGFSLLQQIYQFRNNLWNWTMGKKTTPETSPASILPQLNFVILGMPEGPNKDVFSGIRDALESIDTQALRHVREQQVAPGETIISTERVNTDFILLLSGTCAIQLQSKKKAEPIIRTAPDFFGEISLALTKGKPTANVVSMDDCHILRMPKSLFQKIQPTIADSLAEIMTKRMAHTQKLTALRQSDLNPAQVVASVRVLKDDDDDVDRKQVLDSVAALAERASDMFTLVAVEPGEDILSKDTHASGAILILDGTANFSMYGMKLRTMSAGDLINNTDISEAGKKQAAQYTAVTPMSLLSIDAQAFLTLRPELEEILENKRKNTWESKRMTGAFPSVSLDAVNDKTIALLHQKSTEAQTYVPKMPLGNDLVFTCGKADQMLCWLGVLGILSFEGTTGWRVVGQTPEGLVLKRFADAPVTVSTEKLAEENLRPATKYFHDTTRALETYTKTGLSYEAASFLVEQGIVPNPNPNPLQLATFGNSFEHIHQAIVSVKEWSDNAGKTPERKMLADMLQLLLIETTHQIGITTLMKDPAAREMVLDTLDTMLKLPHLSEAEFSEAMQKEAGPLRESFATENMRFNGVGATTGKTRMRLNLLLDSPWKDIYSITSPELSPTDSRRLQEYVTMLDTKTCPTLVRELQDCLGANGQTLPLITGRTKTATGILEKIQRMRAGNRGKEGRDTFCLADLPDAVGTRVIVGNMTDLAEAMQRIEQIFGERIIEKDDFYGNPEKQQHPYRLVTYTIECDGVPAEIQLQTLASAISAAIDHDTVYKPYIPSSFPERNLVTSLQRRVAMTETRERLGQGALEETTLLDPRTNLEKTPMRHVFQSVSTAGKCVCTYVSEANDTWQQDLMDARTYFHWHESAGATVTTHHGSSVIDCSACVGIPSWQEFRNAKLQSIQKICPFWKAIDALVKENVPLFVLETLAEDVNAEKNEGLFLKEIMQRFDDLTCRKIYMVLRIGKNAHAKDSYAIEKVDESGQPVYPSSLLLKDVPYSNHCVQVARLGLQCGLSADAIQALLLHDAFEDTNLTAESVARLGISDTVIEQVEIMTKQETEDRAAYMERMKTLTGVPKIEKALDRYHNLLRAFNLRDSEKYLRRIVQESKEIFTGDFGPHNAALSHLSLRYQLLLEAVEQLLERKFPPQPITNN